MTSYTQGNSVTNGLIFSQEPILLQTLNIIVPNKEGAFFEEFLVIV
jgi:hypothetical protein